MDEVVGMPDSSLPPASKWQADAGYDTYQERVLRNEGKLEGLEQLVKETRAADAKLVGQRSDSLAAELLSKATVLENLMNEQRGGDQLEYRQGLARNVEQSQAAIEAAEQRATAVAHNIATIVEGWRQADTEAREHQAGELARRLEILNHAHERQVEFQANSVTRELFAATLEAMAQRERTVEDKIAALDRSLLGMATITSSDKAHEQIQSRIEVTAGQLAKVSDSRLETLNEKIAELRDKQIAQDIQLLTKVPIDSNDKMRFEALTRIDNAIAAAAEVMETKLAVTNGKLSDLTDRINRNDGRGQGYASLYGWAIAALGLIITVVILANTLIGK